MDSDLSFSSQVKAVTKISILSPQIYQQDINKISD